jgi:predicted Zn-dependent protease with MMP-like domain
MIFGFLAALLILGGPAAHAESGALYQVLYEGKIVSSDELRELDLNGDGRVDMDDLVELNAQARDHLPPRAHEPSEQILVVVPRYADQAWWMSDKLKAATILRKRLRELDLANNGKLTKDWVYQLDALNRDLKAAESYGLVCGDELEGMKTKAKNLEERSANGYRGDKTSYQWRTWKNWVQSPAEGSRYISDCAKRLSPGAKTAQTGLVPISDLCFVGKIIPFPFLAPAKFKIESKANGRMRLELPINFEFVKTFPLADRTKFDQWWAQTTACVRDYWSRYSVDLEFVISEDMFDTFKISPEAGRSDSMHLFMGDNSLKEFACETLVHELGHHLGLPDRYHETQMNCPFRNVNPATISTDMMAEGIFSGIENARFYPRDLELIFGSVCGAYH